MTQIKTTNSFVGDHTIVEYELFTLCDKSCSYCYNVFDTNGKRYNNSLENVIEGLRRIMTMDNKKVIIQLIGGEVMLHKNFKEIIDFIYDNRHPDHKITLFTHADHPIEFFTNRLELLKKFDDSVRISCTLHLEGLNRERFIDNIKWVDDNFKNSNLFFFTDDTYLSEYTFLEKAINSTHNMKLFPIALDQSTTLNLARQLINMNTKFDKYLDRMDTQYEIDGVTIPYNKGKYTLFKNTGLTFTGGECTIRAYEVDRFGDITMACFSPLQKPLGNIFENNSTELLNSCSITCKQKICQVNLVSLKVNLK